MSERNLKGLRDHLFETLERLKDEKNPMELDRAKMIAGVAQTIINSATVEVKAMNAAGFAGNTGFFDGEERHKALPAGKPNGAAALPPDHRDVLQKPRRTEPSGR